MSSRTPPTLHSRSPAPSLSHARPQVPTNVTPAEGVLGEILLHKSYLHNYCQKLRMPLPIYQTEVESGVYPTFRSTVRVRNETFTSANKFSNRASAEQDVAKLALKHLLTADKAKSTEDKAKSTNLYLRELVCLAKGQWKTVMNEFSGKMKIQCAYETVRVQCLPPLFVSSLTLNSTCYKGETGKNKKEAEQLAARAAILSLLDDPTFATRISQFIKAKVNVPNTRVTGNELKITTTSNSGASANAKPLNPIFRWTSINPMPITPALKITSTSNSGANAKPLNPIFRWTSINPVPITPALKITSTSNSGANAKPLNPIFRWSSVNPVPITPALDLADVPSSSRKRQLGMNEKEANKKLCAYSHAKNK